VIDFRYHLVSIIAVFLALAVGLALGATALSGPVQHVLRTELSVVSHRNATLIKNNSQLSQQVNADQVFAQVASPRLLDGLLSGESAVLIVAPGANSAVTSGVSAALHQAGATVTGQVQLTDQFMDPTGQNEAALTQLAQRLKLTAGVTLPGQAAYPAVAGQQDAALVIAASVLTNGLGLTTGNSQAILDGFAQAGFINSLTAPAPAELAVLVTPSGPPPASDSASEIMAVVAQELKAAGSGTVMAGDISSIGSGSAIDVEDSAGVVSTVDNADTESGQIMVVWALRQALDGMAPGKYGVGPAAAPSPAPTPSVSASPSSTAQPGGHK
jgi:Copper transport outer membrane protein, MctB